MFPLTDAHLTSSQIQIYFAIILSARFEWNFNQIQLQIGSILNPHQPLSVRALTLQERKLAFVIFPFIIEETKDSAGPPSGSNGKSDSCEVTVFSPRWSSRLL
ncbi:hypothetical protein AAC387_Pa12g1235 [Persea americana]